MCMWSFGPIVKEDACLGSLGSVLRGVLDPCADE